jgi:hypothetical protein
MGRSSSGRGRSNPAIDAPANRTAPHRSSFSPSRPVPSRSTSATTTLTYPPATAPGSTRPSATPTATRERPPRPSLSSCSNPRNRLTCRSRRRKRPAAPRDADLWREKAGRTPQVLARLQLTPTAALDELEQSRIWLARLDTDQGAVDTARAASARRMGRDRLAGDRPETRMRVSARSGLRHRGNAGAPAATCRCGRGACTPASSRAGAGHFPVPPGSGECDVLGSSSAWHPRPSR